MPINFKTIRVVTGSLLLLIISITTFDGVASPIIQKRECSNDEVNFQPRLLDKKVILFGEIHGTDESPKFLYDFICQIKKDVSNINVMLEIPSNYQSGINDFLSSSFDTESLYKFLKTKFWQRKIQDGRSSAAMLNLLVQLKKLNIDKGGINIYAVSPSKQQLSRGITKTEAMSKNIIQHAYETSEKSISLVLVGKAHVLDSKKRISKTIPDFLTEKGIDTLALIMKHDGGTSWNCIPDKQTIFKCGEVSRIGNPCGELYSRDNL